LKILMFGRGVIATTYGWALERAGHQIEFYVRPGRAATYGSDIQMDVFDLRRGVTRQSITQSWPVRYRETLDADNDFDLIVLSVSHHHLPEAVELLAPRIGNATVLMFGNIWTSPTTAIGDIPADQVAWGFPGGGGGFGEDGVLRAALLKSVIFGTVDGPASSREQQARQAFRMAGFRISERPDFRGWLWIHFVADAGIHSQGLRLGSLSKVTGNTAAIRKWLLATRELLPLLTARGVDLRKHRGDVLLFRAPSWLTGPLLSGVMRNFAPARRSMEAHTDPDAAEAREICRDTWQKREDWAWRSPALTQPSHYSASCVAVD
jgi:2-dehydropantoate 2-reductase